ncbi:MAG: DsbA family protein [Gemmatimonadaceae bacterium]|nr:DsbA family protein [Gemmatimonadaceae bacterium]
MRSRLESATNVVLIAGVIVAIWTMLKPTGDPLRLELTKVDSPLYEKALELAEIPESSHSKLLVVSDYQCPGCRAIEPTLDSIARRGATSIGVIHLPLNQHRRAFDAARLAECARNAGRFREVHTRLFERQADLDTLDLLSLLSPTDEATRHCFEANSSADVVKAHTDLATQLHVSATPTIIINGRRLSRLPSKDELIRLLAD